MIYSWLNLILKNRINQFPYRVGCVDKFSWFAELDHALFQVVQRTFHQDFLFFVVSQQMVPQLLLGKNFWVSHNDNPKS